MVHHAQLPVQGGVSPSFQRLAAAGTGRRRRSCHTMITLACFFGLLLLGISRNTFFFFKLERFIMSRLTTTSPWLRVRKCESAC